MGCSKILILVYIFSIFSFMWCLVLAGDFKKDVNIIWGGDKAKILENGQAIALSLDRTSGSGFQSKAKFLFGKISMNLKLVSGNSAGTVTSYYVASKGAMWDEIDFEFLGNLSGDPYTVHTNVITQGKGDREQQFRLWFDPTINFHTYSILWNPRTIIFYVDGTPIRQFKNMKTMNVSYPEKQAMRVHSSLWDGDDWATRGGLVKTDWSKAPFTAYYKNYEVQDCVGSNETCGGDGSSSWINEGIDDSGMKRLKWVQKNFMIYDYCNDPKKFRLVNVLLMLYELKAL
ncbi:PREDICTED: xyloglucan endotransglucosylase/hydrolase protein 24-like [Camelina sativa]|uniref:Xyloglucan endotransglucosylase/hydrolase n=1 Tax=Camelina sativa TaxID=90675 RepID=A0ABM0UMS8_CAMSA|nr:PREDICTED: xyloglucan endotransglucosylase/hydrolase protein 24-like [Camelina sativa]